MFLVYSLLLTIAILVMTPLFLLRRDKYASGFRQRLGDYTEFNHDGRDIIWLHCVSVGETNAARPLVEELRQNFPNHRLVFSTTTRTGQELAKKIFNDKADAVIYFPFDFKSSVRRALQKYKPSLVLLMETEIWPRFIREAKLTGAKVAIVNGRLSEKSFRRYSRIRFFIKRVLADIDLALMQSEKDADRLTALGIDFRKLIVTGNLKFEIENADTDSKIVEYFRSRFHISGDPPLIVAASTHRPEEEWILKALQISDANARLMIAPRHPERFDEVAELIKSRGYSLVRRSDPESENDKSAQVMLLDSIGELRDIYALADLVFVGGSLIPHGGQSILEPAAVGKAIITGPYTHNFEEIVREFRKNNGVIQLSDADTSDLRKELPSLIARLLHDPNKRAALGENAARVMASNRGSARKTADTLKDLG